MQALPQAEHSLKAILDSDTYSEASAFMHLLAEGNILTMFRFSEFISPTPVDKRMFQLVMQDEARHVSYGLQHLKWILDNTPERREQLHAALDEAENFSLSQFDSALFEAMIVLAGKGTSPEQIKKGIEIVGHAPGEADRGVLPEAAPGGLRREDRKEQISGSARHDLSHESESGVARLAPHVRRRGGEHVSLGADPSELTLVFPG